MREEDEKVECCLQTIDEKQQIINAIGGIYLSFYPIIGGIYLAIFLSI